MQAGGQEFDSPHLHQIPKKLTFFGSPLYRIVSYYQVIDDMEVSCKALRKSTLKTEQCKDKELIFQILESRVFPLKGINNFKG